MSNEMWMIKVMGTALYLHKSSNMFTADIKQARVYKNASAARTWIESRREKSDYNKKFKELNFVLKPVKESEGK